MPVIKINFQNPLNTSVQAGDNIYYSEPQQNQSGFNHPVDPINTAPIILGTITKIKHGIPAITFTNIGSAGLGASVIQLAGIDNDIVIGMVVSGLGIPIGTEVIAYDKTTNSITINSVTTIEFTDEILTFNTTPTLEVSWIQIDNPLASTVQNAYYFFSKDNSANLTSLAGYYAEIEIRNDSTIEAEMFRITTDFSQSSR